MAEKISFSKPSLSPQQQVALLESRGVQVNDREEAEHFLRYHNYYQISGYVFYFEVKGPARTHQLAQPISFSDLISLTLTELRNTCAHHMRLWNKVFVNHPKIRKADETFPIAPDQKSRLGSFLPMIFHLMRILHKNQDCKTDLLQFLRSQPLIKPGDMGLSRWP